MQISMTITTPINPTYLHHFNDPILFSTPQRPPPLPSVLPAPLTSRIISLKQQSQQQQQVPGRVEAVKGSGIYPLIGKAIEEEEYRKARAEVHRKGVGLEGLSVEGISIGGLETCVIVPEFKAVFDIGRSPSRAVHQNFVFITHAHLDHIGGLPMYVATRELYSLKPPTIFVPPCIKEDVEKLFDIHRSMGQVELNFDLVALDVGETYELRNDLVVRPFRTYHAIPSQGYVIYSIRKKLKKQYIHLKGKQIEKLKKSGVEITDMISSPEVAFTGDTTPDFMSEPRNADAMRAKLLITEATFLDDDFSIKLARDRGHTHLFELIEQAQWIRNKAILLTHFSSRYHLEDRTSITPLVLLLMSLNGHDIFGKLCQSCRQRYQQK